MFLKALRASVLAAMTLWAAHADAAPMSPDPTGMWYDPAQPGWGLSLTQQGETIFAALFVYDANHNPQWFVASNVVDTGTSVNMLVGEVHAGPLYRTTGASFTNPSDTTVLDAVSVGTIQIAYVMPTNNLSVTYTVNGTTVNKVLARQTWGSNAAQLVGHYSGALIIQGVTQCMPPAPLQQVTTFTIAQGATPDALTLTWGTGIDTACTLNGTYVQQGQFGSLTGPVLCGPIPNVSTNVGSLVITQMTIGSSGFSGFLNYDSPTVNNSSCAVPGSIGGVKN